MSGPQPCFVGLAAFVFRGARSHSGQSSCWREWPSLPVYGRCGARIGRGGSYRCVELSSRVAELVNGPPRQGSQCCWRSRLDLMIRSQGGAELKRLPEVAEYVAELLGQLVAEPPGDLDGVRRSTGCSIPPGSASSAEDRARSQSSPT